MSDQADIETPETILHRFAIAHLEQDVAAGISVSSMPVADLVNPLTNGLAIGALAILLDAAGGNSNHFRRTPDEWTVTSELALEISPDGIPVLLASPDLPVVASSRPLGPKGATALSVATLAVGDVVIGGGTVRSFYLPAGAGMPSGLPAPAPPSPRAPLADLMSIGVLPETAGSVVLAQHVDPILNNSLGIVNGGVASAGLELAASAVINTAVINAGSGPDDLLRTASLRVNFLRPFFAGGTSRYVGTSMRVGRRTAVGDAEAIGDDGKVALTARVTAYR
ncbi:MAG: PaaI family thioesterase [Mycobacterium sp.]